MKRILFSAAILIFVGAGCISFEIRDRESAANKTPVATPELNVNAGPEVPPENANVPVDLTAGWEIYRDEPWAIEMKYPSKYKTVFDTYGWPHALVHFIEVEGSQSYRAQIETWDSESGFRESYGRDPAFIAEHPNGKNWITVDYNLDPSDPAVGEEWRIIVSTLRFTIP